MPAVVVRSNWFVLMPTALITLGSAEQLVFVDAFQMANLRSNWFALMLVSQIEGTEGYCSVVGDVLADKDLDEFSRIGGDVALCYSAKLWVNYKWCKHCFPQLSVSLNLPLLCAVRSLSCPPGLQAIAWIK